MQIHCGVMYWIMCTCTQKYWFGHHCTVGHASTNPHLGCRMMALFSESVHDRFRMHWHQCVKHTEKTWCLYVFGQAILLSMTLTDVLQYTNIYIYIYIYIYTYIACFRLIRLNTHQPKAWQTNTVMTQLHASLCLVTGSQDSFNQTYAFDMTLLHMTFPKDFWEHVGVNIHALHLYLTHMHMFGHSHNSLYQ